MAGMDEVNPAEVLRRVSEAMPEDVRPNITIVGSLAAAYWLFKDKQTYGVRTKDIDSVISPYVQAVDKGTEIAEKLLAEGWMPRDEGDFAKPGSAATLDKDLPAMRLYPPGEKGWFLELLTEPASEEQTDRMFTRFVVKGVEHYGLPSFAFMGVAVFEACATPYGLKCALPRMMALANLLENPAIKDALVKDTGMKRSNKDLGRVLAIARLSDEDEMEEWPAAWRRVVERCFPKRWREFRARTGDGIRALIASPADLAEAVRICNTSLLARQPVRVEELRATGLRLLGVVEEFERGV